MRPTKLIQFAPKSEADKIIDRYFTVLGLILVVAFAWFVFR